VTFPSPFVVSPSTVSLDSKGVWVTVHAEIDYRLVTGASVTLNGIEVISTFADDRGGLVAKFSLDAVKAILAPGSAVLTLSGETKDGETFSGSDTVRVVAKR